MKIREGLSALRRSILEFNLKALEQLNHLECEAVEDVRSLDGC
jgi:hypothetical protein